MGYMGLGMQRWISTMKPRKFLGKRSKPDGGGVENHFTRDINDYYHLKAAKLDNLAKKEYSGKYRLKLTKQLKVENRKQVAYFIVSLIISIILLYFMVLFLRNNFDLF